MNRVRWGCYSVVWYELICRRKMCQTLTKRKPGANQWFLPTCPSPLNIWLPASTWSYLIVNVDLVRVVWADNQPEKVRSLVLEKLLEQRTLFSLQFLHMLLFDWAGKTKRVESTKLLGQANFLGVKVPMCVQFPGIEWERTSDIRQMTWNRVHSHFIPKKLNVHLHLDPWKISLSLTFVLYVYVSMLFFRAAEQEPLLASN